MSPHPPPIQFSNGFQMPQRPTRDRLAGGPDPFPLVEVMTPPANALIDLLTTHYPAFEQTHPLQAHVRHVMQQVMACHTPMLGGHVERCPHGHIARVFFHSCGHRCCPRCAGRMRRNWLRTRQATLLPVRHYHVVFTVSHAFNDLWRWNPRVLGDLLFHSATDALRALLADPRHLGAEPGMTVTLETWDDRLCFHPHLHCLVTGGGITPEGDWTDVPNPRCLVPVRPLMWEFRKRFCRGLTQAVQDETLTRPEGTTTRQWLNTINRVNRQHWAVFIAKPPEDGGPTTEDILRYQAEDVAGGPLSGERVVAPLPASLVISPLDLGMLPPDELQALMARKAALAAEMAGPSLADVSETLLAYLKSFPLSASRLEEAPEGEVRFRYGTYDPETGRRERTEVETLPSDEFLRRYLQHIPPPRYQTVRHYGLYTSGKQAAYEHCREILADRQPPATPGAAPTEPVPDTEAWIEAHTCPVCGQPLVVSALLPSMRTGRVIPRVRIGQVFAHAPPAAGGAHAP